ncbi:MAG: GFA family protein [Alphaproteobacteria bacterium]|nr:GFA family protein [Alphaproteobacteria bacterium]
MKTGSCLCGAVAFEIHGPMDDAVACHCSQCRKMTGNYWTSTHVTNADLKFTRQDGLKWYVSSPGIKRGFCKECGSSLFWKKDGSDVTSMCVGAIDGKSGLKLGGHIYCDDAGDYYDIVGGTYRKAQW